jgi:peptidase M48-like protein
MPSTTVRLAALLLALVVSSLASQPTLAASMAAVVHKASVDVRGAPDFKAPTVATLKRNAAVTVAGQQGMWFRVELPAGQPGFVRINDVRVSHAGGAASSSGVRALFGGQSGKGRTIETAGVRGLDEAALRTAGYDAAQMAKLASYRATPEDAAALARSRGWSATRVAFTSEARPGERGGSSQAQKRGALASARGLLSQVGGGLFGGRGDDALKVADAAAGKSEEELSAEELALGPELTGRLLGAAPLVDDADAQRRVNLIGRWMASQTTRPELPWSFGVIESGDVNAFAAPGGYVLVTRGLYDLLADDTEVAAVLGHEISHVVQRDHYNVIRKQAITEAGQDIVAGEVSVGGDIAAGMAKDYVRRHGATVMLTRLDRDAEYRADEASEIYLARSGFNPLGLYAVLQKMTALGAQSPSLAQLYKTHPALGDRLDRIDRRSLAGLQQYTQRN